MPRRYFYTDPLAAAFMAKHFGMVIDVYAGVTCMDRHCTNSHWIARLSCDYYRFYIHPDSLHLLEPKVGDLLRGSNNKVAMYYMGDTELAPSTHIVQRDGKPFFWPESEGE